MQNKILIIIPARLSSSRLPNKPLADIGGKTMIQRVYEQAVKAKLGDVVVACDGEKIANEVKNFAGKYVITDPNLPSGTDRIYAALKTLQKDNNYDIIVNLQGDLPNIEPKIIKTTAENLAKDDSDISTIASKVRDKSEVTNPNVVKIAIAFKEENFGHALYFSRCPIPYAQNGAPQYFHHIGIYAYKRTALEKFIILKQSQLEKYESLEQLRALENNMKISVGIVDSHPISVDTREDLEAAIKSVKSFA